jgi:hypothetical protein
MNDPGWKLRRTVMSGRIPARITGLCAAFLTVVAVGAVMAGAASAEVVYNNVPSPLPGNFASIGLAATSSSEFGGQVQLAGTARKNPTVTVVMSSWTCETGTVQSNCVTAKNKTFKVPVTIRIYGAGPGELAEAPLAEKTRSVKMSYRPSSEPVKCPADATGGRWFDAATSECSHGFAFPIAIKVRSKKIPRNAIVTVSYPTTTVQAQSLNISTSEPSENTLSVGNHPLSEWIVNSTWSGMYGSAATPADIGKLGPEIGLDSVEGEGVELQPVIAISAE